jgi:Lar family restriction alleviation protein
MTTPDKEEMPTEKTVGPWSVSHHHARIVHDGEGGIVQCDTPEVASRIVTACNAYEPTREALKPFADELNDYPVDIDGSTRIWDCKIRVRDLRNAAAAYAALSTLPVNDRQTSSASNEPDDLEPGELLPCPFCGGEPERIDFDEDDDEPENIGGSAITCKRCQCSTAVVFGYKETLFSSWNERVPVKAQPASEAGKLSSEAQS